MEDLARRIERSRQALTPSERRVADAVLRNPEGVAFGTVATLARQSGTSGASVVRLASRLGYDGFVGLQSAVQQSIGQRLRPATERIRHRPARDVVERALSSEVENVRATLDDVDRDALDRAAALLGRRDASVAVLAGDAEHGIGTMLATSLTMLRPGVEQIAGSDVAVARRLAHLGSRDVLVAIDLRRYERWVLEHTAAAAERGVAIIALTDSQLSPLADVATVAFRVTADAPGPFDSHVGTLALVNVLVTAVAARHQRTAAARLDHIEAAWRDADALVE